MKREIEHHSYHVYQLPPYAYKTLKLSFPHPLSCLHASSTSKHSHNNRLLIEKHDTGPDTNNKHSFTLRR